MDSSLVCVRMVAALSSPAAAPKAEINSQCKNVRSPCCSRIHFYRFPFTTVNDQAILMLTRKRRLNHKEDIDRIFRSGQSISNSDLALKFLPNNLGQTRATAIVGTKLSKKAPTRNRIKRRLREILRLNFDRLPANIDLLVIARSIKLRDTDFTELARLTLGLIAKIKLPTK